MADTEENLVPEDDVIASEKPDAVVVLENKKPEDKKTEDKVIETPKTAPRDAAEESVEALAKNLAKAQKDLADANAEKAAPDSLSAVHLQGGVLQRQRFKLDAAGRFGVQR